ncbi:STAS domain-containing protein [Streptomyces sp. NPDC006632]|uniref:STAS domain-containing protein n=1 Tax=unclassified Streptomyces TaxID=2593676 RepID=UPI002E1BDF06
MTDRLLTASSHTHARGARVVVVAGELDHHTAPELSRVIQATAFDAGVPVLIDLSDLAYCDSTGITVLIGADRRARDAGTPLSVVGVPDDLMHVFRIIGLDQLFTFRPTVEDAINALYA